MHHIHVILTALPDVCTIYKPARWSATANQCHPPSSHVVTTSTKSTALLHSQFVNGNTIFASESKQPSLGTDGIYSSKVETARTDDDFQGLPLKCLPILDSRIR
jgi:hypothetical protein